MVGIAPPDLIDYLLYLPRHLPERRSFPTRRSSDLGGAEIARMEWYREGRVPLHTLRADVDYGAQRVQRHAALRSEEHMSELQSRGQLVCRLLLGKKK